MIRPVPSAFTGEQRVFLSEVVAALNALPTFSFFSAVSPESVLTGVAGNVAINPFSLTTAGLLFVKWGSATAPSKVSWTKVSLSTIS